MVQSKSCEGIQCCKHHAVPVLALSGMVKISKSSLTCRDIERAKDADKLGPKGEWLGSVVCHLALRRC